MRYLDKISEFKELVNSGVQPTKAARKLGIPESMVWRYESVMDSWVAHLPAVTQYTILNAKIDEDKFMYMLKHTPKDLLTIRNMGLKKLNMCREHYGLPEYKKKDHCPHCGNRLLRGED